MTNPLKGKVAEVKVSGPPIGVQGLLAFIDELNDKRQDRGIRQRYRPTIREGIVSMEEFCPPPSFKRSDHSPKHYPSWRQWEADAERQRRSL